MKVVLLQKVAGLGSPQDVKDVAEGYARNFLFPRHLAVPATAEVLSTVADRKARTAKVAERDLAEQQKLASRVDGQEVEIRARASEKGALYAAVTATKVAEALAVKGYRVTKDQIIMKPIKNVGSTAVRLKFRHGLEAEITVMVTSG